MQIVLHWHGFEDIKRLEFAQFRKAHGWVAHGGPHSAQRRMQRAIRAPDLVDIRDDRFTAARAAMLRIERVSALQATALGDRLRFVVGG